MIQVTVLLYCNGASSTSTLPGALGRTFSVGFLRIAAWCRHGKGESAAAGRLGTTRAAKIP